ncbi:MAG TPA: M67 family metallopeptidase [Solirubrobacteraceae bacterium]|nr:M67 family metallopeptidase [Solirubrobacteraceae bacterium]
MVIAQELLAQIVEHALSEAPNECCGVIAFGELAGERRAARVHPARNAAASPLRFEIDPREVLELHNRIEAEGLSLGAIYHSHTRTAPYPSQTDINFAQSWPGVEWLIVGLAGEEPAVRSYLIDGAVVSEVVVEVAPAGSEQAAR